MIRLLLTVSVTLSLAAAPCYSSPIGMYNRYGNKDGRPDEKVPPCAHYMYQLYSGSKTRFKRDAGRGRSTSEVQCDKVTSVPDDVKKSMELSDFYAKYTHAYGIPVISSKVVSDESVKRACYVTRVMLADRKDIRDSVYNNYGRVGVIAISENTTDIPEHSWLDDYYNIRARGLGGTMFAPISTVGEENTLCHEYPYDPYHDEDILVHEFAHGIHRLGIEPIEEEFSDVLHDIYDEAMGKGLWNNTYASVNFYEYFAKAVQSYFFVNAVEHVGLDNHVNTRPELKAYDHRLYSIVKFIFPCGNQIVERCKSTECADQADSKRCKEWAVWGECDNNPKYMVNHCKRTCKDCNYGGKGKPGDEIKMNCPFRSLQKIAANGKLNPDEGDEDNKIDENGKDKTDDDEEDNTIDENDKDKETGDSDKNDSNEIGDNGNHNSDNSDEDNNKAIDFKIKPTSKFSKRRKEGKRKGSKQKSSDKFDRQPEETNEVYKIKDSKKLPGKKGNKKGTKIKKGHNEEPTPRQITLPVRTTPEETTFKQTTLPAKTTPEETTPKQTTLPVKTTPEETTPKQTTLPVKTTPEETTPKQTTLPAKTTPEETTPKQTTLPITTPAETTQRVTIARLSTIAATTIEKQETEMPCLDMYQDCRAWAAYGGCESHPSFMLTDCKESCNMCSKRCEDMYPMTCKEWAKENMCMKAMQFMWHYCPDSCGLCKGKRCENLDLKCEFWASEGHCYSNPTYMAKMCKRSCRLC
ncbi:uncharacterized protein [Ptychodera flava]|uniref:uncharacterized protein isoform X3 n=1 Tax=Ptychodera flava TaxID=63121 RepID=UPI003969EDF3